MSENINRRMVLEELRGAFDKIYVAGDSLDGKLHNLLNFSSLIVSFGATLQISTLQDRVGISFWALLVIVFLLYLVNFIVIASGLKPQDYIFAIKFDREWIFQKYFKWNEAELMDQMTVNYLDSLDQATAKNSLKVKAIKCSNCILFSIVALLLVAVPIGLIYPEPTLFKFFHIK